VNEPAVGALAGLDRFATVAAAECVVTPMKPQAPFRFIGTMARVATLRKNRLHIPYKIDPSRSRRRQFDGELLIGPSNVSADRRTDQGY
jgi:hypothetical protein